MAQAEIEKVRKRREERAAERALQEEELSVMQRERAVLEGIEMEAKEEEVQFPCPFITSSVSCHDCALFCQALNLHRFMRHTVFSSDLLSLLVCP